MAEYRKEISAAIVAAIVIAAGLGAIAIYSFPGALTSTVIKTTGPSTSGTTTITSTVASTTSPCGSPGTYCGKFNITSGSLTVNGSTSILEVTLLEIGNMYIGSATVYVNGTVVGVPPASEYGPPGNIILNVQPAQQTVLVLTIPNSTVSIHVGRTYTILVYGWLGPPGERASSGLPEIANITAT